MTVYKLYVDADYWVKYGINMLKFDIDTILE